MPSANNDSFTFFLQILVPVISLFYLIAVAKTSKSMLNKNGESRCPCLVHDLKEKLLLFPIGDNVSCAFVKYGHYYVEYVPSISNLLRDFIISQCWVMSNPFSTSIDMII